MCTRKILNGKLHFLCSFVTEGNIKLLQFARGFFKEFFFHFRVFLFYLFQNIRNYSVSRGRKRGILSRQKQPFADVLRNRCCNIYKKHRSRPATLLEKIPQQECFPVNITKFLRTAFCKIRSMAASVFKHFVIKYVSTLVFHK